MESLAREFIKSHFGNKKRKNGELMVNHSIRVGEMARKKNLPAAVVLAAILHDVVEDTDATIELVEATFGESISELVSEVTFEFDEPDLNEELSGMSKNAREIKLLDRLDNARTLRGAGDAFRERFKKKTNEYYLPILKWEDLEGFDKELEELLHLL